MNIRETLAYIITVFIFVGCVSTPPKVEHPQLDQDKKEFVVLNNHLR